MKSRIIISAILTVALAFGSASLAFAGDAPSLGDRTSANEASIQPSTKLSLSKIKDGLVKKGSSYYFYNKGKMVKKAWKTVNGAKYYFQGNGKAAVGSVKIKGVYYIFNANGKLVKGKKTRVVTIKKVKYQVTKSGKAKSGWNSSKTSYFGKTGKIFTNGTKKIGSKTYCFDPQGKKITGDGVKGTNAFNCVFLCANSDGSYNAARTKQLNAFAKTDALCSSLIPLLGTSSSLRVNNESCYRVGGEDFVPEITRTYANFKLVTYRTSNGNEYFGYLAAK